MTIDDYLVDTHFRTIVQIDKTNLVSFKCQQYFLNCKNPSQLINTGIIIRIVSIALWNVGLSDFHMSLPHDSFELHFNSTRAWALPLTPSITLQKMNLHSVSDQKLATTSEGRHLLGTNFLASPRQTNNSTAPRIACSKSASTCVLKISDNIFGAVKRVFL